MHHFSLKPEEIALRMTYQTTKPHTQIRLRPRKCTDAIAKATNSFHVFVTLFCNIYSNANITRKGSADNVGEKV